jgi:two-component system response regulator YesN
VKTMIVEDEPNAMERYSTYIASYDPSFNIVAKATTYKEACELFDKTNPDLIFSDVVIPGRSGLDFIKELREKGWKGLVVVISGYGDFSYAQQAIKLSVFDYLLKPVFQKDLEQVLDKILAVMNENPPMDKSINQSLPPYIQKAIRYIEMNYNRLITLPDAAQFSNVSPAYLSAQFSLLCGMTFIDYLQMYRSKVAAKYLVETNQTLDEIAERVGFGDSSYLNRCFKKQYKMTPGQYRRQTNENNL